MFVQVFKVNIIMNYFLGQNSADESNSTTKDVVQFLPTVVATDCMNMKKS
jgi:hypothetical protein